MLSDSIHTSIYALLEEIKYYSRPPFEYGTEPEYKAKFIESLTNLFYILHSLDGLKTVDMDLARLSANQAWDNTIKTIEQEEREESEKFAKAIESAHINKLACPNK